MFVLTSPVLEHLGVMPDKYTLCKGENISPPLSWRSPPKGTKSFALAVVDHDGAWGRHGAPPHGYCPGDLIAHWMVYDIPANVDHLDEGVSPKGTLPKGAKQLNNMTADVGPDSPHYLFRTPDTPYYAYRFGYMGPEPPPNEKAHRYEFTLYALNVEKLEVSPKARYHEFIAAIAGKVIGRSSFTALYGLLGERIGYHGVKGKENPKTT